MGGSSARRVRAGCSSASVAVLLLGVDGARAARTRHGQDAAVRQQERVPGRSCDMPEGTPLETTARVAPALARRGAAAIAQVVERPELRRHVVAVQLQRPGAPLLPAAGAEPGGPPGECSSPKDERSEQSHAIAQAAARRARAGGAHARRAIQVVEVPPGPPVLQTLVAEVYGPDPAARLDAGADRSARRSSATPGVVDVDWYVETPQPKWQLDVDAEKAAAAGVSAGAMSRRSSGWRAAGTPAGLLHDPTRARGRADRAAAAARQPRIARRARGRCGSAAAAPVAVGELDAAVAARDEPEHLSQEPAAGDLRHRRRRRRSREPGLRHPADEPRARRRSRCPKATRLEIFNTHQPFDSSTYAMKWDGEWHITYEVFRDLGIAFAAVLVLIYILVVGWFQSFMTPLDDHGWRFRSRSSASCRRTRCWARSSPPRR